MADLFIYDLHERCLRIELKVNNVWQPGQKEMADTGFWKVAWTFEEFKALLFKWESHE